nr:PREDICTED: UDP-glucuronosyltransferase 2B15-like [Tribolium castaneum]|eukprot:XP_008191746.2 PREDICTED: UDP-glucuronosyltransferase 2B15-like [Tribolium castaneum]
MLKTSIFPVLLIFLVPELPETHSANILGILPYPGKSHSILFETLLKRLAEKGHEVDYVTFFPSRNFTQRYNELSLYGVVPNYVNNVSIDQLQNQSLYQAVKFMTRIAGADAFSTIMKTPVLQNLRNTTNKYDLIIVHSFGCDIALGFGYLFNAPVVAYVTSVNLPWIDDRIGNPDNPAYIQSYLSRSSAKMKLYERIENTIYWIMTRFWFSFFSGRSDRLVKKFFGPTTPSLENLIRNTSLVLVNSHFSMQQARPLVPNFIEVGGLHIREPQPLPKDLENLVSNNTFGVVYLSMGSMVRTESFKPEILQAMFDAFAELPYTVLWKASPEKFPKGLKIPENIHFKTWMPQIDILCHPNVKLFISHGGLLGSQEAVYCAIPRIGIPFFDDQELNIVTSEKLGIAKKLSYGHINKNTLLNTITELFEDLKYRQNVERISKIFKDRPMSPLDTAIYWVEYVIRYKGAPHLRSVGADLPWYQFYLVDVTIILLFGSILIIYILKYALRCIDSNQKHKFE